MNSFLVLTFIADDKPGVVEQLAEVVVKNHGSWLESRMSHLAGKFAGIARIQVPTDDLSNLSEQLETLRGAGFTLSLEASSAAGVVASEVDKLTFNIVGQDRPGIVHEIAQALARHHINLTEMRSDISSAPMTGEPWFEAIAEADVPDAVSREQLQQELRMVGDELNIDIVIET